VDILADSKAAIQAVSSNSQPKSKMINDIKQALKHLHALKETVIFQWVPSHVGLAGNKIADKLAKNGTTIHTKETPLQANTMKESQNSYEVQSRNQQAGRNKEMERYPQNLGRIQRQ
jgi:ribonuclease HI